MRFGNPVRGAIAATTAGTGFRMTQDFGPSSLSAEPKVVWAGGEGIPAATYAHFHRGIDLGNKKCGSDVLAAAAGTVRVSYKTAAGEHVIVVDHGGGWCTSYGHLASRTVAKGAKVAKGQKIGTVGATGNAIGCHLHFGVKSDVAAGANYYANSAGKMLDPWRRLEQNVKIRPDQDVAVAIRIRSELSLDKAAIYAKAEGGRITRLVDAVDLGSASEWRDWDLDVAGPEYASQDGSLSTRWSRILLDGAYRFIAGGYAELSA